MPEIYTNEMKILHSKQKSNPGSKNGNSIYSDKEVLTIRRSYANRSLQETYNISGNKSKSIDGFRNIIKRSYKPIPIYNKKDKKWFLNNNVIDINEYNPVSTISESGE